MERVKLARNEITLDQPIQWSIYGANGQLLLRQGSVVSKPEIINKIFQHNPFRNADMLVSGHASSGGRLSSQKHREDKNPFNEITRFSTRYRNVIKDIEKQDSSAGERFIKLAISIQELVSFDEDACLGAIHLYYDQQYTALQPIYKAILCELTASLLDYDAEQRLSLLAAALSANIGLIGMQEQLNKQSAPLSEHQLKIIRHGPARAVELLRDCGVTDADWLKTVIENHERNDGKGYPWGLKSKYISPFAKILGLADTYLAMTTKRAYREAQHTQTALKEIYQMASKEDEQIYLSFLKQIGANPPGTLVKLKNNDVAVVTYRGFSNSIMSSAMSIVNESGQFYASPVKRDTSLDEFKVMTSYTPTTMPHLNPDQLWSYK